MSLAVPRNPNLLRGRTALVTGGAGGLGYATASRLLALGGRVFIADINAAAGDKAAALLRERHPAADAEFLPVDLSDMASVRALAEACAARCDRLDLLLNNAGIYPPAQRMQTAQGWELSLAIALIGPQALTLRLLPLLERSEAARVVGVTSLVQSQFATLESPVGEPGVLALDASQAMDELVARVRRAVLASISRNPRKTASPAHSRSSASTSRSISPRFGWSAFSPTCWPPSAATPHSMGSSTPCPTCGVPKDSWSTPSAPKSMITSTCVAQISRAELPSDCVAPR